MTSTEHLLATMTMVGMKMGAKKGDPDVRRGKTRIRNTYIWTLLVVVGITTHNDDNNAGSHRRQNPRCNHSQPTARIFSAYVGFSPMRSATVVKVNLTLKSQEGVCLRSSDWTNLPRWVHEYS